MNACLLNRPPQSHSAHLQGLGYIKHSANCRVSISVCIDATRSNFVTRNADTL
jgi:hypothetical protein